MRISGKIIMAVLVLVGFWAGNVLAATERIMVADFDKKIKIARGYFTPGASGKISITDEKALSGKFSGKIEYDFTKPKGSVEFWIALDLKILPKAIGIQVLGDGTAKGLFLRLRDRTNEVFQWTAAVKADAAGWQLLQYPVGSTAGHHWSGNNDGKIDLPVTSVGFLLANGESASKGAVFIDDIAEIVRVRKAPGPKKANLSMLPAEIALQHQLKKTKKKTANPKKAPVKRQFPVEAPIEPPKGKITDAVLPKGVICDWSLNSAWKRNTPKRGSICLNGLWRFRPAWTTDGKDLPKPGSGWGCLKVPGGWPASHRWGHNPYSFIPIYPPCWNEVVGPIDIDRGDWHYRNRKIGKAIPFDKVKDGWYEREFEIPLSWKGRDIYLRFDMIEQRARVYVNGLWAGQIFWPDGRIDITKLAKVGEKNVLTVRVMTPGISTGDGPRGIAGDVFCESASKGARITDIITEASFRKKSVKVKAELAGLDPYTKYRLTGEFRLDGKPVKKIESPVFLPVDMRGSTFIFEGPWSNPKYWDFGRGNLYEFYLSLETVDGKLVDAALPRRFGFREFWIEGRHFMLNGRKIHPFGDYYREYGRSFANVGRKASEDFIRNFRAQGFNLIKMSIYDYNSKLTYYPEELIRAADREGMYVLFQLPRIFGNRARNDVAQWDWWRGRIRKIIKRWRNHPSIIFYATDQGTSHHVEALNPRNWTGYDRAIFTGTPFWNHIKLGTLITEDFLNHIDPTRVTLHLGGGNNGKVISVYPYYNFTELQEAREHPLLWMKTGTKPLFYSEWGMPFKASFTWHRKNNPYPAKKGISPASMQPAFVELAAITKGDRAYELTNKSLEFTRYYEKIYEEGEGDSVWYYKIFMGKDNKLKIEQNFVDIQNEHLRELVPYFRAMEMSGIIPFDPEPLRRTDHPVFKKGYWKRATDYTNLQQPAIQPDIRVPGDPYTYPKELMDKCLIKTAQYSALQEVLAPRIAFIAGGPVEFTRQDHNCTSGEKVAKLMIVVNDEVNDADVVCEWRLVRASSKREVKSGALKIKALAGEVAKEIIAFDAPSVNRAAKFVIEAKFKDAKGVVFAHDAFALHVLPEEPAPAALPVALLDTKGLTAERLKTLGINFSAARADINSANLTSAKVLVIGRETLDTETPLKGIAKMVRNGLNVLVMEQSQEVLENRLGFRVADPAPRRTWMREPQMTVFKNLLPGSLSQWRGDATLITAFREYATNYPYAIGNQAYVNYYGHRSKHVWKWGNTGAAASVVFEKPHRGNFTPLSDCGVDMGFAPLLEYREGKGRVVFSQYDISGRTQPDPAADKLLRNMIEALATKKNKPLRKTFFAGDDNTLMKSLGFYAAQGAPGASDVLVLAEGAQKPSRLPAVVFCLGLDAAAIKNLTGLDVTTRKTKVSNSPIGMPNEPVMNGLGNSEFYWRGEIEIPAVVKNGSETYIAPNGVVAVYKKDNSTFVLCQVRPDWMDYKKKVYLKFSYLKTVRMIRQLLTNSGAQSQTPVLDYLEKPVAENTPRWAASYYINKPEPLDDPYRYQHW